MALWVGVVDRSKYLNTRARSLECSHVCRHVPVTENREVGCTSRRSSENATTRITVMGLGDCLRVAHFQSPLQIVEALSRLHGWPVNRPDWLYEKVPRL